MYFQSLDALLYMDGHGVFVWSAYLITASVLAIILILPGRRRRQSLKRLAGEVRRQQTANVAAGVK